MFGAVRMIIRDYEVVSHFVILIICICTCLMILVSSLHILFLSSIGVSSSVQFGSWWNIILGFVVVCSVVVLIMVKKLLFHHHNLKNLRCYKLPLITATSNSSIVGDDEDDYAVISVLDDEANCSEKRKVGGKMKVIGGVRNRAKIVLFGSSIVQYGYYEGWAATLSHLYARKADLVLRGYAAWNSRRALQVLDKIFPKNAIEQPSLVIVYFGGNDSTRPNPYGLGPHVPLQEYVQNMRKIATHLRCLSKKTRIIFLSTPPINEAQISGNSDPEGRPLKTNEGCRIYSEACLELCREMNIKSIDLWTAIQQREDWKQVSFIDGIHLTNEASKIVVKEILKVLKEADWEPSLHYKSMPTEFSEDSPYDPVAPDGKSTVNVSDFVFPNPNEWDY